ncbi:tRNA nucleotidyltransferase [Ceratobasidium sp. AG-Ba]|nr:tRNA nucleotidyltransferase [Ceratobasidium sp. AG-Ba]
MESKPKLEDLSKEDLIARIYALEALVPSSRRRSQLDQPKPFPFDRHPTRKIALKFSYAGWAYNGLAAQAQPTPLPTVEQVLFDALVNARLVDPAGGMDGCGWSRCGRTDRGVSAAGQVVSLRVRSALGSVAPSKPECAPQPEQEAEADDLELDADLPVGLSPALRLRPLLFNRPKSLN